MEYVKHMCRMRECYARVAYGLAQCQNLYTCFTCSMYSTLHMFCGTVRTLYGW